MDFGCDVDVIVNKVPLYFTSLANQLIKWSRASYPLYVLVILVYKCNFISVRLSYFLVICHLSPTVRSGFYKVKKMRWE